MQNNNENKNIHLNVDFNCDLAQSYGVYKNEDEEKLLDYVSSVNISCGLHAGEPLTIRNALLKAKERNLAIGAHIGFPDIQGFGNRAMLLDDDEIEAIVIYQIGAIKTFAKSYNLEIEHVRLHGAMYKMAMENFDFSLKVANAIKKVDKWLIYYGAACETLEQVAAEANIRIAREIAINMPYTPEGNIILDKTEITNADFCAKRLEKLLKNSDIKAIDGSYANIKFDTIHFSSKSQNILEILKKANEIITPHPVNYNNAALTGWV